MLAERGPAAVSAWQTLFGQITSTLEVPFDAGEGEEPHTIDRLLAHVRDPDRDLRRRALETLYAALEPAHAHAGPRLRHAGGRPPGDGPAARLRGARWSPPTCATSCPARWWRACSTRSSATTAWPTAGSEIKAGILGLDRLELHDQYAPIGEARAVDYPEARGSSTRRSAASRRAWRELAGGFFAERRIDAEPRSGKRGGAFCAPVAQDASPYILMNFTDRMDDVMTLAHELGHGMHFTLAAARRRPSRWAPAWRWPRSRRRSPSCSPSTT